MIIASAAEREWYRAMHFDCKDQFAADVVQDAWLSTIRCINQLSDPAAFRSWIFRIVYNKSMDSLRIIVRERNELERIGISTTGSNRSSVKEDSNPDDLRRLIAQLSRADRAVLALYYENGKSIREIAQITGHTESSAKSRLHHTRQKLRTGLIALEGQNYV